MKSRKNKKLKIQLTKTCIKCKIEKPLEEFVKRSAREMLNRKTPYRNYCKECDTKRRQEQYYENHEESLRKNREWYYNNKEKSKSSSRRLHLLRRYGLSEDQYDELLEKQDYKCTICERGVSHFKKRLSVDHAHSESEHVPEGAIRGLICNFCNRWLIGRHIDPKRFENAAKYLMQHTGLFVPAKYIRPSKRKKSKTSRIRKKIIE